MQQLLAARKRDGFVRECHGDVHLANLALLDDKVVLFDCLEFNDNLRWIDVMNEVAFTVMDLDDRGQQTLARRFLNAYLEHSGDYAGLALLRFYQVYRALVRAKVSVIRLNQAGLSRAERNRSKASTAAMPISPSATPAHPRPRSSSPTACPVPENQP